MNMIAERKENLKRIEDRLFDLGVEDIKFEKDGRAILRFVFPIEGLDGMRVDLRQGKGKAYKQAIERLERLKCVSANAGI